MIGSRLTFAFGIALAASVVIAQTVGDIQGEIGKLRSLPDDVRSAKTRELALQIRALPDGKDKVLTAEGLCNLATEGDFGPGTLQTVADTLVAAIKATPPAPEDYGWTQLANLKRYEDLRIDLDHPSFKVDLAKSDATYKKRAAADFTLTDLTGKKWTRSSLKGKVVLVNFWATWCPPCRKEMPDLTALAKRFSKDLVILGITDEDPKVVNKYLGEHPVAYPVLLDPGRKVNTLYEVDGIPKNLIYDRSGKLVAQSIDMRTMDQFLKLLAKAGLK
jgi:hypothetical protein